MVTASVSMSVKRNIAAFHLRAAANAARAVYEIAQREDTSKFGDWFERALEEVSVAIIMAGAALEASANEFAQNVLDGTPRLDISKSIGKLLSDLIEERSGNSVSKFEKVANLLGKLPNLGNAHGKTLDFLFRPGMA